MNEGTSRTLMMMMMRKLHVDRFWPCQEVLDERMFLQVKFEEQKLQLCGQREELLAKKS